MMNKEYLFSFIVPVYNTEKFLSNCLDSFFIQCHDNYEVVIVNDGSTGNCRSIVKEYQKKFKNIVYIEQTNQGLSAARNKGIDLAKGEYCCFVDSDDYIDKDYVAILTQEILNYKFPDLLIIGIDVIFETKTLSTISPKEKILIDNEEGLRKLFESQEYRSHACTKIIKTDLLKTGLNRELYFPLNIYYEDVATIYKWIEKAENILLIPKGLYKYNVGNPDSITSQNFSDKHFDLWNKNIDMYYNLSFSYKLKKNYFLYLQDLYLIMFKEMKILDKINKKKYIDKMREDMEIIGNNRLLFNRKKVKKSFFFVLAYHFPKMYFNILKIQEGIKIK